MYGKPKKRLPRHTELPEPARDEKLERELVDQVEEEEAEPDEDDRDGLGVRPGG
jgi:hypothetical protein